MNNMKQENLIENTLSNISLSNINSNSKARKSVNSQISSNSRKQTYNLSSKNLKLLNEILKENNSDNIIEMLKKHILSYQTQSNLNLSINSENILFPIEKIHDIFQDTC